MTATTSPAIAAGQQNLNSAEISDQEWCNMRRPEQQIHMAVVAHLRQRGERGVVFLHPPNGVRGNRHKDKIQGAIAKGMGVRAGASDLLLWHRGKSFALELKAPGGRPTKSQLEFIAAMEAAGARTCIAHGLDRALEALEQWQLLRPAI
jgi:hypothetical protein